MNCIICKDYLSSSNFGRGIKYSCVYCKSYKNKYIKAIENNKITYLNFKKDRDSYNLIIDYHAEHSNLYDKDSKLIINIDDYIEIPMNHTIESLDKLASKLLKLKSFM